MDGLIFFFFLIFFVFPLIKNISKSSKKTTNNYQKMAARLQAEAQKRRQQSDHGMVKERKHRQLHTNDGSNVFPEEHQANVQARDKRDRAAYAKMEATIHSRQNRAMTKIGNRSRTDWGARGDNGLSSSKSIIIVLLLALLAYLIVTVFFPDILP